MPSKRRKSKTKPAKSKTTKRAKNKRRAKSVARPKRAAKKKLAKKKSAKVRPGRTRSVEAGDEERARFVQRSRVSGRQSGDLQGLSRTERADSESVEELAEEGNLFEAGAVAGVEQADNADEREVHTREVPEDDVPDEYLEKE